MATKVMVGNLPPGTTEDEVREEMVRIGAPVLDVEMIPAESGADKLTAIAELDIDWTTAKIMENRRRARSFKGRQLRIRVMSEAKK
jgi:RNA recognition motif-containing protein